MLDKSKMPTEELKRYEKFEDEFFDVYNDDEVVELTPEEIEEDRLYEERLYEERKNRPKRVKEKISIELFDERTCRAREISVSSEETIRETNEIHKKLFGCDYIPYKYYKKS